MSKKNKKIQAKRTNPPKSLKDKLQKVYNTVNLNTTCLGRCECCKVSMPQLNRCEFEQLVNEIWDNTNKEQKKALISTSIEYFLKNQYEKFGMETLVKPCQLLSKDGKCRYYDCRPLSCRMYGLWPQDVYNSRVDKFEKAYGELGLKREQLPLNKQCPHVKRVDESIPLTEDAINGLYKQLDDLDKIVGGYTDFQIENKENYRTFHDWLLLKIFGEQKLVNLTTFIMSANKEAIEDLIKQLKITIESNF